MCSSWEIGYILKYFSGEFPPPPPTNITNKPQDIPGHSYNAFE